MGWYRLSLRLGIRKRMFPIGEAVNGTFYSPVKPIDNYPEVWKDALRDRAERVMHGKLEWFSYHEFEVGQVPDWFKNPFSGSTIAQPARHWTKLSDFDLGIGDIKTVWEPSRFDWLTDLACAYRVFGDQRYLMKLNDWLNDWSTKNPVNSGPNWKCGQETSIRLMKLLYGTWVLGQFEQPTVVLSKMVFQHLERVAVNIRYAVAQDNNHGTTEAAALFILSAWLRESGVLGVQFDHTLHRWQNMGERIWNERIEHLVGEQGTFSQRSVTYHRVVVDTASFVLFFGNVLRCNAPSQMVRRRLEALAEWQFKFIITENGDSPNMGANDGAMLEKLHACPYRDFRPSCQLVHWLLHGHRVFESGPWDETIFWRDRVHWNDAPVKSMPQSRSEILDRQFLILRNGGTHVFVRIPDDRFRPFASDAFHIDVWHQGKNVVLGSGTYSYNSTADFADHFKSVKAHNTVQFGNLEQMPRISKFLLGKWIKADDISEVSLNDGTLQWSGGYADAWGNRHQRSLRLSSDGSLDIKDSVKTNGSWTVRFNLGDSLPKRVEHDGWETEILEICGVSTDSDITIEQGYTSLYYHQFCRTHTFRVVLTAHEECMVTLRPKLRQQAPPVHH